MSSEGPHPMISSPAIDSTARRIRVVLLFGGRSGEHAISCATAAGVMRAIDRDRYDVTPIGITRDGRWALVDDAPERWDIRDGHLPEVTDQPTDGTIDPNFAPAGPGGVPLKLQPLGTFPHELSEADVVFPLLHGPFGEDGTLQGLLEMADVRYVGSGVLASAVGMDKHFMKVVCATAGLPIGPYTVVLPGEWDRNQAAVLAAVEDLGLPLFVKPARAGSSLGITRVTDLAQLADAISVAAKIDPKIIIEAGIIGREIETAVLGGRSGERARSSLPGEIEVSGQGHAFYDFAAKYLDEANVTLSCPAKLPADVLEEVRNVAVRTFEAVEAEGLSRVDVFVTEDGSIIVNEINTMPGFTPFSMYPRMWQASGLSYSELIDELITLALNRPLGLR